MLPEAGAAAMRAAIAERGEAVIVLATRASQFETMAVLTAAPGIAWDRVTAFHLDEYIGFPADHPASFRGDQRQRFMEPLGDRARLHEIDDEAADLETEAARLSALIADQSVDVCFAGLGESCYLAFNDPPASAARPGPPLLRREWLADADMPGVQAVVRKHSEGINWHQLGGILDSDQFRDRPTEELRHSIVRIDAKVQPAFGARRELPAASITHSGKAVVWTSVGPVCVHLGGRDLGRGYRRMWW